MHASRTRLCVPLTVLCLAALLMLWGCAPAEHPTAVVSTPPTATPMPTAIAGSHTTIHIDYADFLQGQGIRYSVYYSPAGSAPTRADLGPKLGSVRYCYQASQGKTPSGAPHQPQDGDAGILPIGTPIYAVRGYPTTARLAAIDAGGTVHLYLAQ